MPDWVTCVFENRRPCAGADSDSTFSRSDSDYLYYVHQRCVQTRRFDKEARLSADGRVMSWSEG